MGEPTTEAGKRLLDAYFQPAEREQELLGGGGIEHLVAAIEAEARAAALHEAATKVAKLPHVLAGGVSVNRAAVLAVLRGEPREDVEP